MSLSEAWKATQQTSTLSAATEADVSSSASRLTLTLVAHPDPGRIGEQAIVPRNSGVALSRSEPLFSPVDRSREPCPLLDPHLSRSPLRLTATGAGLRVERADCRSDCWVGKHALGFERELSATDLETGVVILLAKRIALLAATVVDLGIPAAPKCGLVGHHHRVERLRREILVGAASDAPVFLRGETGTGKELAARALHEHGKRRRGPFLALNLAAVPATLGAAELFGAERGAFSGAERPRPGFFQRAEGGTLFLDEVGAASQEIQDLLLRALETGELQRVGGSTPVRTNVRIVTATDADLPAAIASGSLRSPLYHRLAGWEIRLPTLRERREDIPRLLLHFLRGELAKLGATGVLGDRGPLGTPWLPARLLARLVAYDWPGNVRELRNVAQRLAMGWHSREQVPAGFSFGDVAKRSSTESRELEPSPRSSRADEPVSYRDPREVGERELRAALARNGWKIQPTARALGVARSSLYALIERSPSIRSAAQLTADEMAAGLAASGGDVDAAASELEVSSHGLRMRIRELGIELP